MSLKDRIPGDRLRVFINLKHFASEHTWTGKKFVCVVDEDEALKRKNNNVNMKILQVSHVDGTMTICLSTNSPKQIAE